MASESIKTSAQMVINFLGISMKNRFALRRGYDKWTCKQILSDKRRNALIKLQGLEVSKHAALGSDLAVAKFVLSLRGCLKNNESKRITKMSQLPRDYDESFRLIAADMSDCSLVTEGTDNFVGLDHLESLNLSKNPLLDDFACDQLSRQFRYSRSLCEVDLSYNPLISVYGIEVLLRIPSLRKITAIETQASKFEDIDLFTLTALEERDCRVMVHPDGRQFKSQELENLRLDISRKLEASHKLSLGA